MFDSRLAMSFGIKKQIASIFRKCSENCVSSNGNYNTHGLRFGYLTEQMSFSNNKNLYKVYRPKILVTILNTIRFKNKQKAIARFIEVCEWMCGKKSI